MSSFAALAAKQPEDKPKTENAQKAKQLHHVQLDGRVILQIAKHSRDSSPQLVTGQLLGLDVGNTLEVTSSFPFPSVDQDENQNQQGIQEEEGANYQLEMMRMLREVNVDNNTVGWYQSTTMGSYYTEELIETFVDYAESIERCVCIVYDPSVNDDGMFGLKAIRLTEQFLKTFKECGGNMTSAKIAGKGLKWSDVIEEIPIVISNSVLVSAMMSQLDANADGRVERDENKLTKEDLNRLHLNSAPFSQKSLEFLSESMDDLVQEQQKVAYYHRANARLQHQKSVWLSKKRQENKNRVKSGLEPLSEDNPDSRSIQEPNRLETYLIFNQVNQYAKQLDEHNAMSAAKLKLVSAIRSSENQN
jgi:translation initiation factor 3 subunit H